MLNHGSAMNCPAEKLTIENSSPFVGFVIGYGSAFHSGNFSLTGFGKLNSAIGFKCQFLSHSQNSRCRIRSRRGKLFNGHDAYAPSWPTEKTPTLLASPLSSRLLRTIVATLAAVGEALLPYRHSPQTTTVGLSVFSVSLCSPVLA